MKVQERVKEGERKRRSEKEEEVQCKKQLEVGINRKMKNNKEQEEKMIGSKLNDGTGRETKRP